MVCRIKKNPESDCSNKAPDRFAENGDKTDSYFNHEHPVFHSSLGCLKILKIERISRFLGDMGFETDDYYFEDLTMSCKFIGGIETDLYSNRTYIFFMKKTNLFQGKYLDIVFKDKTMEKSFLELISGLGIDVHLGISHRGENIEKINLNTREINIQCDIESIFLLPVVSLLFLKNDGNRKRELRRILKRILPSIQNYYEREMIQKSILIADGHNGADLDNFRNRMVNLLRLKIGNEIFENRLKCISSTRSIWTGRLEIPIRSNRDMKSYFILTRNLDKATPGTALLARMNIDYYPRILDAPTIIFESGSILSHICVILNEYDKPFSCIDHEVADMLSENDVIYLDGPDNIMRIVVKDDTFFDASSPHKYFSSKIPPDVLNFLKKPGSVGYLIDLNKPMDEKFNIWNRAFFDSIIGNMNFFGIFFKNSLDRHKKEFSKFDHFIRYLHASEGKFSHVFLQRI